MTGRINQGSQGTPGELKGVSSPDMKAMIADYMEQGFLENIIDMFKHDKSLYSFIGELMTDERMRVRLGTSALVEILAAERPEEIGQALPGLLRLLRNEEPTIRGDAAYLLGIVGFKDTIPFLQETANDENRQVREIAAEAIREIQARSGTHRAPATDGP